jgi:hypothetical protein
MNLFNKPYNQPRRFLKEIHDESFTFQDEFLQDHHLIVASDLYLKEIELKIDGISDFNKDKHTIQSLLEKFEEIEFELVERYESKESIIRSNKSIVSDIESETNWEFEECRIGWLNTIPAMLSEIEESSKIQSLISEIRERKSKVDERLKELGIKL